MRNSYPAPDDHPACECKGNPLRAFFCSTGHMTECHYPMDCRTANCSHMDRYEDADETEPAAGPPLADDGYPVDWPRCASGCGRPALDGHYTCGSVECDEGAARRRRE